MKRDKETIRSIAVTAIAAALLAFVVWQLAAADSRTSPPELPTATPPMVDGTTVAPYPPPPGADPYPEPYPAPVYLPFNIGDGDAYP